MTPYRLHPYDDASAMAVFSALDVADAQEVELVRGVRTSALALFADWRSVEPARVASFIACTGGGTPFAIFGLMNTGQAGVAAAALLARDHRRYRPWLAALAVDIRRELPAHCATLGIARVEARSWAGHPTASRLLRALGFCEECDMPGFGPTGRANFLQFALTIPVCPPPAPEEQS